jgi:hypothetical protein
VSISHFGDLCQRRVVFKHCLIRASGLDKSDGRRMVQDCATTELPWPIDVFCFDSYPNGMFYLYSSLALQCNINCSCGITPRILTCLKSDGEQAALACPFVSHKPACKLVTYCIQKNFLFPLSFTRLLSQSYIFVGRFRVLFPDR